MKANVIAVRPFFHKSILPSESRISDVGSLKCHTPATHSRKKKTSRNQSAPGIEQPQAVSKLPCAVLHQLNASSTTTPNTEPNRLKTWAELNMKYTLLPLIAALLSPCSITAHAQLIVAHRGASHEAPENTIAAFQLAWEKQADAIEGDFYVTKDNQIACIHDKTTRRVAPKHPERTVATTTLDDLRQLDVGSWKHPRYSAERIPTLQEVLATVPDGKQIFVEIKCGTEILPLLQPQLDASGLQPDQIVIICFNQKVISECRRTMPKYRANWLTGYKEEQSKWKPEQSEVLKTLKKSGATGLGTNANLNVVDRVFVNAVRDAGRECHVWTVNDAESAKRFAELGVHSITTDSPGFIRNALRIVPSRTP